jgi:hypothetical protein
MEFPEDVLGIISEYSKPRMRFLKEFNAAARDFETVSQVKKIVEDVKEKLMSKDAEKIIELFVAFVAASVATKKAQENLATTPFRENPEVWMGYVNRICETLEKRESLTRMLFIALYGRYPSMDGQDEQEDEEDS